ncbi:MAG: hypothetical protein VXB67_12550, partial [Deltaproteobacteria bacterium]
MKRILPILIFFTLVVFGMSTALKAEILARAGYQMQQLSASEGYNKFLKDRYGFDGIQLTGSQLALTYKMSQKLGVGLESSSLSANPKYKTLNGDEQEQQIKITSIILLLTAFQDSWEWTAGYGIGTLSRRFYGYNDSDIVTSNIAAQTGTKTSETSDSITLLQALYHIINNKLQWSAGARYTIHQHNIPA